MTSLIDHYAVIGNPVKHSKSPAIHTLFAEATHQQLEYSAQEAALDGFEKALSAFFQDRGGKGLSITVPFKEEAWELASIKTVRAQKAGAVNTLWVDAKGELNGDNTDGVGLVRDLTANHSVSLTSANILVLGAGGAVKGILAPLLQEQPSSITIANRTLTRAQALAASFKHESLLSASTFEALNHPFDIIINGTAASLQGQALPLSPSIINSDTVCYDMMYGAQTTVFNQWAQQHGAQQCIDGLGMLVEQAAEQFFIWRGIRPDTASVLNHLRQQV